MAAVLRRNAPPNTVPILERGWLWIFEFGATQADADLLAYALLRCDPVG